MSGLDGASPHRSTPPAVVRVDLRLDGDPGAAHLARTATTQLLHSQIGANALRQVLLVVSELVTNAQRHGEPPIALVIATSKDVVTIAVTDHGARLPHLSAAPGEDGGFGLHVVAGVAQRWGVSPEPGGKAVWCTIKAH